MKMNYHHLLKHCGGTGSYWDESMENCYSVLDVTCFGWKVSDGSFEIYWDDPSNIARVCDKVRFVAAPARRDVTQEDVLASELERSVVLVAGAVIVRIVLLYVRLRRRRRRRKKMNH